MDWARGNDREQQNQNWTLLVSRNRIWNHRPKNKGETKTILEIIKLENNDTNAHCDWSADYDKNKETGKYIFITKIINVNQPE